MTCVQTVAPPASCWAGRGRCGESSSMHRIFSRELSLAPVRWPSGCGREWKSIMPLQLPPGVFCGNGEDVSQVEILCAVACLCIDCLFGLGWDHSCACVCACACVRVCVCVFRMRLCVGFGDTWTPSYVCMNSGSGAIAVEWSIVASPSRR